MIGRPQMKHVARLVEPFEMNRANPGVEALPIEAFLDRLEDVIPDSLFDGCTHGPTLFFAFTFRRVSESNSYTGTLGNLYNLV
jgi:hypothetical protein